MTGAFGRHVETLEAGIEAAMLDRRISADWTAMSLARRAAPSRSSGRLHSRQSKRGEIVGDGIEHLAQHLRPLSAQKT
ncbi:hypothetical protein [Methylocystis suflitae]|uniref:hypothetical protein n=1 Tax=Methylocystis suflitae TaxID=2951405 RepID=UPI00210B5D3F|nr:hypothetical protein [Methylocystis suflitae]MCQ4188707.1 hypothetical protein [Methylocystis suflitae]